MSSQYGAMPMQGGGDDQAKASASYGRMLCLIEVTALALFNLIVLLMSIGACVSLKGAESGCTRALVYWVTSYGTYETIPGAAASGNHSSLLACSILEILSLAGICATIMVYRCANKQGAVPWGQFAKTKGYTTMNWILVGLTGFCVVTELWRWALMLAERGCAEGQDCGPFTLTTMFGISVMGGLGFLMAMLIISFGRLPEDGSMQRMDMV